MTINKAHIRPTQNHVICLAQLDSKPLPGYGLIINIDREVQTYIDASMLEKVTTHTRQAKQRDTAKQNDKGKTA